MRPGSILSGVLSIGALLLPSALRAQTHKVEAPAEVTRAVGVYEWAGELAPPAAARLIPVSLFVEDRIGGQLGGQLGGHFEDAGVYLAQPVPFALQPGDLYSIERSGRSLGLLELTSAQDIHTRDDAAGDEPPGSWYGYGRLLTAAEAAEANAPRKAPPAPRAVDAPPVLRHRSGKVKAPASRAEVTPPSTPLNEDPDRPILHRGIPAEAASTPRLDSLPPNLHQAVAISDAINRSTENFVYMWPNGTDRAQTLIALKALARPILERYLSFNKLTAAANIVASVAPSKSADPSFANVSSPRDTAFSDEQIWAYTLSSGAPGTFVYTAEAPVTAGGPVYITLIAQRLPSGELHLALSSITDAAHLDRTPRLLLIDAVDPDASHRASLLFELRARSMRQFALYSISDGQAQQTFITGPIE